MDTKYVIETQFGYDYLTSLGKGRTISLEAVRQIINAYRSLSFKDKLKLNKIVRAHNKSGVPIAE